MIKYKHSKISDDFMIDHLTLNGSVSEQKRLASSSDWARKNRFWSKLLTRRFKSRSNTWCLVKSKVCSLIYARRYEIECSSCVHVFLTVTVGQPSPVIGCVPLLSHIYSLRPQDCVEACGGISRHLGNVSISWPDSIDNFASGLKPCWNLLLPAISVPCRRLGYDQLFSP